MSSVASVSTDTHCGPHAGSVSSRLNRLRAGALGANDGIIVPRRASWSALYWPWSSPAAVSAALGGAPKARAVTGNVAGGALALGATYVIRHPVGAAIA
jgi:hypothetical protein